MSDTPDALGPTLHALARAHRARLGALLAPHGLHAGQDLLLLAVWDTPGIRQSTLAEHLGVEPPTVTRMVQRLERGGMIERRTDPVDGRAQLVHPTPRSRLLESMVRRAWASLDELMMNELGSSDAVKLQKLAMRALGALEPSS
jgi:MarR family transcriptional regulator, organic hydroperoxide resistance regulator